MASIGDITDQLEAAVKTTGLRILDGSTDPAPPTCIILPTSGKPRTLGAVKETQEFVVKLIIELGLTRIARDELDAYLSPTGTKSIRAAINAHKQLSPLTGVVAVYQGWENYGNVEWAGIAYFGADVLVTVEN